MTDINLRRLAWKSGFHATDDPGEQAGDGDERVWILCDEHGAPKGRPYTIALGATREEAAQWLINAQATA